MRNIITFVAFSLFTLLAFKTKESKGIQPIIIKDTPIEIQARIARIHSKYGHMTFGFKGVK